MKYLASLALALAVSSATPVKRADPHGIDVSSHQPNIDWTTVNNRLLFSAYINPYFSSQYTGATKAGLIRGGYHFAHPDSSSGAAQAKYFLAHGDHGAECYGLTASAVVSWAKDFSNTYKAATDR
ncbi:glycoside hydrolase family 25 protein [Paxillus rubicundulus Ve08.2h10]|uniref:Glycoside hydrolase family 25 protein n=1 Tax=Paxillus rubicundulus Ve08.2h10 TaxID=930991 RepID=A0A0D0DCQ2_9AGAM|nr:glycoside hydrolase family 25 protein [Paxillus rubicundulus Ve08.2h10]